MVTTAARPSKSGEVKYLECIQHDTRTVAAKLVASDDAEAVYEDLQLAESAADENQFVGFGMTSRTGEKYQRHLAEEWKKALVRSARKNGVTLDFNTGDQLPIVDVRLIKDKAAHAGEISLKDAVAETAKYITRTGTICL